MKADQEKFELACRAVDDWASDHGLSFRRTHDETAYWGDLEFGVVEVDTKERVDGTRMCPNVVMQVRPDGTIWAWVPGSINFREIERHELGLMTIAVVDRGMAAG